MNRYQRQIILKDFGMVAQEKLLQSKVLVIGAGGLGCPALQYLAGAGVGFLGIADDDVVTLTNLHRQILFSVNDIGKNKAIIAKEKLQALNPEIKINAIVEKITTQNAWNFIAQYDYVLDGTDNFSSRYLINDACVLLNKPLVIGAIAQYEGQVGVLNVKDGNDVKINYRDIFPQPPKQGEVINCAEAGVLGVLPGIIGTMQATEIIKLITGIGKALINQLLTYNILTQEVYTLCLTANSDGQRLIPKNKNDFEKTRYDNFCDADNNEISIDEFEKKVNDATIVDVREYGEAPAITAFPHLHIPISEFGNRIDEIKGDTIIFFCQSGIRSKKALELFSLHRKNNNKLFSLKDGAKALIHLQSTIKN